MGYYFDWGGSATSAGYGVPVGQQVREAVVRARVSGLGGSGEIAATRYRLTRYRL